MNFLLVVILHGILINLISFDIIKFEIIVGKNMQY
jgi:hypothetical protein